MNIERAIDAALRNVARHGDTDIFPFPFENLVFSDRLADAPAVLETIYKDFERWLSSYPPDTHPRLTQLRQTSFD